MKKLPSKCSSLLLQWTVAKIDHEENLPVMWKTVIFLSILFNKSIKKYTKPKFKIDDRVKKSKNDIPFRKGYKPQFTDEVLKFRQYLQKTSYIHHQKSQKRRNSGKNFMKMSNENVQIKGKSFFKLNFYRSVVMNSFNIQLVSNATFNCYPNKSLRSFTKFLPEQTHLREEWEVAISEISYPSLYQNATEEKFTFIDGRESPEVKRKI